MRESELLQHIYARSADLGPAVAVGPGDDAAVLRLDPAGPLALATVDQLVEGRHYDPSTEIDLIARKAVARSVSDVAAMGGTPTVALATAALPNGYDPADELFDRMAVWARRFGCPLAGGDISGTDGPLVLTTTVLGATHPARGPVLRSTARAGDLVCVTGRLGGSLRSGRHLTFDPRTAEATWLCGALGERLTAMIDLSDGLGRDAARVARASGARLVLDAASLPVHDDAAGWRAALGDGEDYELCFTCAVEPPPVCEPTGVPITVVGRVEAGQGCIVETPDGPADASELGWDHGA